jgi:zinc-ribbon domain
MAQQSNRLCPKCNTPLTPGQRFCSNCGSIVEPSAYQPTELTPNSAGTLPEMGTYLETPPPPPPVGSYSQSSMPPQGNYQPPQMGYQPPPSYATPPKDSSKKVLGQIGCGMLTIIVLAVALCGGIGFFAYHVISSNVSKVSQTTDNTTGSITENTTGNTTGNVTPTPVPLTVSPVNATIKYADVDMVIVDVKQAGGFADETSSSSSSVIVRIDLKESNKTAGSPSFSYGDVMRLIMPDGTSVIPFGSQYGSGPDAAVTRTNWLDFSANSKLDVSKLTLQLGKASEAQIAVPLTNNPDVTKYQPKTITPGKSTVYGVTNWTLVSATTQLSGDNEQAPKGQMFVILTLKIDNNSAQSVVAGKDYFRLQTGDTKTVQESDTIPSSFDAGQTNQVGNILFLVPQGSTSFTLLLLVNTSMDATQQSSIAFQIQ